MPPATPSLPLLIEHQDGGGSFKRDFTVEEAAGRIQDRSVFEVPERGLFVVDADRDVAGDD